MNQERETVAVILTPIGGDQSKTVIIPLVDAVAEYLKLEEVPAFLRKEDETRVHAGLEIAIATINTTGAAQQLYDALKP